MDGSQLTFRWQDLGNQSKFTCPPRPTRQREDNISAEGRHRQGLTFSKSDAGRLACNFQIQGPVKKVRGQLHYTFYNSQICQVFSTGYYKLYWLLLPLSIWVFFSWAKWPHSFLILGQVAKSRAHWPPVWGNFEPCIETYPFACSCCCHFPSHFGRLRDCQLWLGNKYRGFCWSFCFCLLNLIRKC